MTTLEVVLGIDYVIFTSILAGKRPRGAAGEGASDRSDAALVTLLDIVFSLDSLMTAIALSFLILIGVTLVNESLGQHIPKGYIYFSMAFAFGVEMPNLRLRTRTLAAKPVELHQPYR